ncbi:PLP-dependent aminotransferase family protein, partial [Serratia marcescens]
CDTLLGRELLATQAGQEARLAERELSDRGRALLAVSHTPHTSRQASLTPSLADLRAFPIDSWLQWEKQALRRHGERLLGYADPQGLPELRAEIAHYLQRERGVKATAEQVIVVTSSQQALALCTQVLFDPGDAVFVEEPGYQGAKKLVQSAGLQARPIGIDEQGLDVGQLMQAAGGGRGVYITPSHHYPLGYSLSLERRLALLQWAQRRRAWIIEDDYDAEFNYDRQTKAALQGLDSGGRTLYIGTFSKTLFPGLRIGFMIAPPQLVRPLVAARQFQDGYTSALAQMTLFHCLHEGGYAEHLRNMRTLYKARLDVLYDAVQRHLAPWTRPALPQGGLQLVCPLADA